MNKLPKLEFNYIKPGGYIYRWLEIEESKAQIVDGE